MRQRHPLGSDNATGTHPIPEYVQRMVAGTNGRMYLDQIGRLDRLPIPEIPIAEGGGRRLLDIGCGWGRWMVAAARRGYVPVGIDIRPEAARAALEVARSQEVEAYAVVGRLDRLPFQPGSFDTVWSFSVLQHAHRDLVRASVAEIERVLVEGGVAKLEFPLAGGLWNRARRLRLPDEDDDPESWAVRYYTLGELERLLNSFETVAIESHCYFGIGIQPIDLEFTSRRYHPLIRASLALTALSRRLPWLTRLADSVYAEARTAGAGDASPPARAPLSSAQGNLGVVELLRCPRTGGALRLDGDRVICDEAGLAYPVEDEIPILLPERAVALNTVRCGTPA